MSNAEQPFYRRPLWIVVAIFLAVVLVGGGIAAVTGAFNGKTTAANPTASAEPTKSALPADTASVCGLKGYKTTNDLTAAPTATWKIIGSMAAPQDQTGAGPGKTSNDGVLNTCFAHTPTGALFASVNYLASLTDARNVGRLAPLFADGTFKDELEASPPPSSDSGDTSRAQVQGFKIDNYAANEATVDLAIQYTGGENDGQLLSLPVVVKWEAGDWKVFISANGAPVAPTILSSLGGYIPFSGV
jgi:hypothetical protein